MSEYVGAESSAGGPVPIKVNRVFDCCCDKDCLTNVAVTLESGELAAKYSIVKARCVTVKKVCITVEPVPFNRGFFAIDLTYTFSVELYAYTKACETPDRLTGVAYASKSCILYGGEANTKTFFSDGTSEGATNACCEVVNLPLASVQIVEPIVLEAKIGSACCELAAPAEGEANGPCHRRRTVLLTLGMFSVVELSRPVTVMVQTYPYTVPRKECNCNSDSPCEMFNRIQFPTEEFSPSTLEDGAAPCGGCDGCGGCGCGCDG